MEILLSLAIAAFALPFVLRELDARSGRAANVRVARDIAQTRAALEKYMEARKLELLAPTGRTITRVRIRDLAEYGGIAKDNGKFQARIIKSRDRGGRSVLSGMVIFESADISPVRTREIAELGLDSAGFVENNEAYGAYGTWRSKVNIFDAKLGKDSIVESTGTILSGGGFLWRLPSDNPLDGSMASDLSLGGYGIKDADSLDAFSARFTEILKAGLISARKVQITPRANWDSGLDISGETLVQGVLTSESRNMEISGDLFLNSSARLSKLEAERLWVGDLKLSGLSLGGSAKPNLLKVAQTIDMVRGRASAMIAMVGFAGSVAPRISVSDKIEDAGDPGYYWDLKSGAASLSDVQIASLGQMMKDAVRAESKNPKTSAENVISQVSANSNATVADYVRALNEIQSRVRAKYNRLNLNKGNVE